LYILYEQFCILAITNLTAVRIVEVTSDNFNVVKLILIEIITTCS